MNCRIIIMLSILGLLTMTATRSNSKIDPINYVEYHASHGGSSWRGRAPVDNVVISLSDERLELKVTVNPEHFNSSNLMRDGLASAVVFESATYPYIVFTASVHANVLHDDAQPIQLTGTLAMHGVTNEVSALVNLERKQLRATGTLEVKLSDYHMLRPLVAGSPINDVVTVTFKLELDAEQLKQVSAFP